jgi:carbonic anhydrase
MTNWTYLLEQNRAWADEIKRQDPGFFERLVGQQKPKYLWIGCSDSRVPATQLVGLSPGELFVHRNVANVVVHTDLNCLSVIQFAVDVLEVEHVIVCGHYGCGGVEAAFENRSLGLMDNWLRHVQDVIRKYEASLSRIEDRATRLEKLCELNVREQVLNVSQTTVIQSAWDRGQGVQVHGWVFSIGDGIIRDLDLHVASKEQLAALGCGLTWC